MRRFSQVDVFGDGDGFGNPLAVVHDADGLSEEEMQRLANWTNLAETSFLLEPTVARADYRVRIFTPARELPFAGHPTLGSADAWRHAAGETGSPLSVQQSAIGLVQIRADDAGLAFAAPPLRRSGPLEAESLTGVCATLGIDPGEVVDHQLCDNGPPWEVVRLQSAERVLALTPTAGPGTLVGVVGLHPDGTPEVRAFTVEDGVLVEDPVTGSLGAGIAQWMLGSGQLEAPYVARQGTAIGRRGRVHVTRGAEGTIWIGGQVRTLVEGTIDV